jgi:hypothetical protein
MRSLARDLALLGCTYLFIWGVSWSIGSRSRGAFGWLDDGSTVHYYPGVLLGGLPPEPLAFSDLPQALAAVIGGVGLVTLIARAMRPGRSDKPPAGG